MQQKCAIFRQKSQTFSGEGTAPSPDPIPTGREIPLTRPLTLGIVHLLFGFFLGHCTYKSSHGKALIWSGKVMEKSWKLISAKYDVVGTMFTADLAS